MGARRRVSILSAAVFISLLSTEASAYKTFGDRSCGQWLSRSSNGFEETAVQGWLMGYMTGLATATTSIDLLASTDAPSVMAWVDNYCRANPLNKITDAGVKLGDVLLKRSR